MSFPGFGTAKYGTTPYGSGAGTDMTIASALAIATSTVLVTLTEPPRALSSTGVGDALNPTSWTVQRLDTGASFPVALVQAQASPVQFAVTVFGAFGDFTVTHQVAAPDLLAADGSYIASPDSATFLGLLAQTGVSLAAQAAGALQVPIDVANPYWSSATGGGTLVIGPDGDYAQESGVALSKKLMIRRLVTPLGGFYHLPSYGGGLGVKQIVPVGNLVKLKKQTEQQAMEEPGTIAANANVSVDGDGLLEILVNVQTSQGSGFQVGLPPTSAQQQGS